VGIPPGDRARVFEMFTRIDRGGPPGHGVGLSTCQRIVARHGGRIWAGPADGGGTVVTFTLPEA
jgi:signal transduction histidine kinase